MSGKVPEKNVTIRLSEPFLECLDSLIEKGLYVSRTEVIRESLRRLFRHYEMTPFVNPSRVVQGQ